MVSIDVPIRGVKNSESFSCKILGRWHAVKDNRFVRRQTCQERNNRFVAGIRQKCVVPNIDHMAFGECLDLGEVHDHAVRRVTRLADDIAR